MSAPAQLVSQARQTALAHALDPALVCAICEQESSWNPWAIRYEPLFFTKYVAPLYTNNKITASEAYSRGFSWGLMQVMGQTAREHAFTEPFLSALCDPAAALEIGCRVLRKKLDAAQSTGAQSNASPQSSASPTSSFRAERGIPPNAPSTNDDTLIIRALLLWNGGANPAYATQVLARRPHYL